MKTFAIKKRPAAQAFRGPQPSRFGYRGPEVTAQQAEIRRILRSTGAQAKLTIGQPNDTYEQEADRVADRVTAMPDRVAPGVHGGRGQSLDRNVRQDMEARFGGRDFGDVRIHTGPEAATTAAAINAAAFTAGANIVFGRDRYNPESTAGRRLLAHELTHVVQQGGAESASNQRHATQTAMPGRASQADGIAHETAAYSTLRGQTDGVAPATVQLQSLSGGAASRPLEARVVQGKGGYSYEQHPDGTIVIRSGPGVRAPVRLTEGKAFESITAEIGRFPGASVPGTTELPSAAAGTPEGGRWLDWLAGQASTVGEAASDLFVTAGEWASGLADAWFSDAAPERDAPVVPGERSEAAEAAKLAGMTGTPLELALEKVGQVAYVDPRFGKGAGKRKFTKAETRALKTGSEDIKVASCSPFAYWTLAASGIDINVEIEGDAASIRQYINIEGGALKGGDYGTLVKAGDERIRGAATAFEKAKIGTEVEKNEACPGDYVQTYSSGLGGHSTIVHRAHCKGAAVFGLDGSPTPQGVVPSGERPTPAGFEGESVRFIMDEKTKPSTVGTFVTEKVELLGAHLGGTSSAGKKAGPGVYTKKAVSLDSYYRAFVGRLNASVWASHTPADPSKYRGRKGGPPGAAAKTRSWWKPW